MAKRSRTPDLKALSRARAVRLCQLLRLLGARGGQTRTTLLRKLRLDVRGFYRDLEMLRKVGIDVEQTKGRYTLREGVSAAINRLPCPDPELTFGEAVQLSKGRTAAHRKLKELLAGILP